MQHEMLNNSEIEVTANDKLSEKPWIVAVFAHNEEHNIIACLESIAQERVIHDIHVYVLSNGCADRTESLVRNFACTHSWVSLVSIALGDKSNAWNVFVHDIAPRASIYFFVDGDIQVKPGSFGAIRSALCNSAQSNAAAAVPSSGRSRKYLENLVCKHNLLLGNLYALRGDFLGQIKHAGIRLPVGYIGDDGLVTTLVKWNLNPNGSSIKERIVPCPNAKFSYHSFSVLKLRDVRKYLRRLVRYSLRHFQHELLVPILKNDGIKGIPETVTELYNHQSEIVCRCRPRFGINFIFDIIAIAQIRRHL